MAKAEAMVRRVARKMAVFDMKSSKKKGALMWSPNFYQIPEGLTSGEIGLCSKGRYD